MDRSNKILKDVKVVPNYMRWLNHPDEYAICDVEYEWSPSKNTYKPISVKDCSIGD